LTYLKNKSSLH